MSDRAQLGMTLLELLVALAVFVIIATASYAGLTQATQLKPRLDAQQAFWQRLDALHGLLRNDFGLARTIAGGEAPVFETTVAAGGSGAGLSWRFTRVVNTEFQTGAASPYRPVVYHAEDGALTRTTPPWSRTAAAGPDAVPLLDRIEKVRARYLAANGQWVERWPPEANDAPGLPGAIEFGFEVPGHGPFLWVFHVGPPR